MPPGEVGMHDPGVLRHRQVGRQRQLLEHAAHTRRVGGTHGIVPGLVGATDGDGAPVGRQRAGQHVHQRRLAGAVVADEADAFAGCDGQVHPGKRMNGAEILFDAVQHSQVCRACAHACLCSSPGGGWTRARVDAPERRGATAQATSWPSA